MADKDTTGLVPIAPTAKDGWAKFNTLEAISDLDGNALPETEPDRQIRDGALPHLFEE